MILDRIARFDPESRNFPVRTLLPADPAVLQPRSYTWAITGTKPAVLDQGSEGACVGYGWAAELAARPRAVSGITNSTAHQLYALAQTLDNWPGEAYSGTSVLAGAKAAQRNGHIGEYRWAFALQDVVATLGYRGPVVLGTNWYAGMYETDVDGWVTVSGALVGGHCLVLRAVKIKWKVGTTAPYGQRTFADVDLDASYATWRNSWSASYGVNGDGKIRLSDLDSLLRDQGEACIPVKK